MSDRVGEPFAAQSVTLGLLDLHRRFAEGLSTGLAEEDSSIDQWRALSAIALLQSPTMGELAAQTGLSNATLTRVIDSLADEALVFRLADKRDRRRINVHLSDFGRRRLERLDAIVARVEQALTDRLGPMLPGLVEALAALNQEA